MSRDRRYSTSAWQRTRKAVLYRDGGLCQVRGPRCTRRATTVHHIIPSSRAPERFFDPTNLQAACMNCNRHGAVVQGENRNFRMAIANLERLVEEQRQEIERLTGELAAVDREPAAPRIY